MLEKILNLAVSVATSLGFEEQLANMTEQQFIAVLVLLAVAILFVFALLFSFVLKKVKKHRTKNVVAQLFRVDLSKFQVKKMGKPGTRYYNSNGFNGFQLVLPHWKKANADGSKDTSKHFNKVIWEESVLWLHVGQKTYVLTTKDPWEMIFLVHRLRLNGFDIFPCEQEQQKQERIERDKLNADKMLETLLSDITDRDAFVRICAERLKKRGYTVSDAPLNQRNIDLFLQKNGHSCVASCLFYPRDHLIGLEEMREIKEASLDYAERCLLITTGRITVVAARFAMDNGISMICDADLVALLDKEQESVPGQEFLRWEFTQEDLQTLLPEDLLMTIFS